MKIKSIMLKSIALLLVFLMLFTALISCAGDNEGDGSGTTDGFGGTGSIVVFNNGAYLAQIIRGDAAGAYDKELYTNIRNLFTQITGVIMGENTDFAGQGLAPATGPAILVGQTAYAESQEVYATLKDGEAKAVLKGDKFIIAYSTEDAGTELFAKLSAIFAAKATATNITITSEWNVSITPGSNSNTANKGTSSSNSNNSSNSGSTTANGTYPTVTGTKFDESKLKESATLPNVSTAGLSWAVSGRDAGHGSKLYIANNAKADNFTKYVAAVKSAGFTEYTTNKLQDNQFATYITKSQIVSIMFFPAKSDLKVVVDPRSTFGLPGTKAENSYTSTTKATEFVQLGMKQVSGSSENGMGYLVKLSNGKFVVVDAGFAWDSGGGGNSAKFLIDTMKKMQGNSSKPVIAAYIITHIHTDHAGGFMGFANSYKTSVTIEKLIYNQPSDKQMNSVSNMSSRKNWVPNAISKLKGAGSLKSVVKAHPGMQIFLGELTITVLGTIDLVENKSYTKMDGGNNSSVVTMFEIYGTKILLTGDAEGQESKIIRDIFGGIKKGDSFLRADFIQVAHHGYGNTNTDYVGWDQNALNVMAGGGGTAKGSSKAYALVPVGLANGKEPAGYYDGTKGMHAMRIFAEDKRIVAANKNTTIKITPDNKYKLETTKHKDGFLIGTWSTY